MTDDNTNSDADSDETETVQLGARVEKDLAELVKGLVRHKHNKIRGPLGDSYETALEYYLAVHLLQHPDDLQAVAEKSNIDDEARAVRRLREALDSVGPDLVKVKQALLDKQSAQSGGHLSQEKQEAPRFDRYSTVLSDQPDNPARNQGTEIPAQQERRLSAEQEWSQSPVRHSLIDETSPADDESLDDLVRGSLVEKLLEDDEFTESLLEKLSEKKMEELADTSAQQTSENAES